MQNRYKILSLFLAFILLFSCFGLSASATAGESESGAIGGGIVGTSPDFSDSVDGTIPTGESAGYLLPSKEYVDSYIMLKIKSMYGEDLVPEGWNYIAFATSYRSYYRFYFCCSPNLNIFNNFQSQTAVYGTGEGSFLLTFDSNTREVAEKYISNSSSRFEAWAAFKLLDDGTYILNTQQSCVYYCNAFLGDNPYGYVRSSKNLHFCYNVFPSSIFTPGWADNPYNDDLTPIEQNWIAFDTYRTTLDQFKPTLPTINSGIDWLDYLLNILVDMSQVGIDIAFEIFARVAYVGFNVYQIFTLLVNGNITITQGFNIIKDLLKVGLLTGIKDIFFDPLLALKDLSFSLLAAVHALSDIIYANTFKALVDSYSGFIDLKRNFFEQVSDFLAFVFVPSDDFFSSRLSDFKDSFFNHLPFLFDVRDVVDVLKDTVFSEASPPVINMTYNGVKVPFIDCSFLEPYISYVRFVSVSCLGFPFIRRFIRKVIDMIGGV